MKRVVTFIFCTVIVSSLLASCVKEAQLLTPAELLDLGEKYLHEMNYEQALVQFLKVIEAEPMIPRGYTGAAEAYLGLGDNDSAIAILQQGLAKIPENKDIQASLDKLLPPEPELTLKPEPTPTTELLQEPEPSYTDSERQELLITEAEEVLSGLAALISDGNPEQASGNINSWFRSFASELSDVFGLPYIIDTEYGRIGVYQSLVSADYFVYYGGYSGNSREGSGMWITGGKIAEGLWSGDAPNGLFEQREVGSSNLWTSVGNVVNGLWDGERIVNAYGAGNQGSDVVHVMQFINGRVVSFINEINGQVIIGVDASGNPNLGASEEDLSQLWGLVGYGEIDWG